MSVSVGQVPRWITLRGVSHAVAEVRQGWTITACDKMVTGDPDSTSELPKKVCVKCRLAIKTCDLAKH
jgi:hypothetical protein